MNYTFKIPIITAILSSILLLVSCEDSVMPQNEETEISIGKLISRSEKIQLGKEWDQVQNQHQTYKLSLKNNPNDNETKIRLAQLFIGEARVTGEHGHYYPAALDILNNALADPTLTDDLRAIVLTTKAGVQLSLHEFSDAKITGQQAALMNPTNAQNHGVLVDAHVELGDYDKAIKLADRMMTIKPDIRSYSRISYLREIHGDVNGSIEAMMMAIKAGYPGLEETAWAMLTLGDIYKTNGEYVKAMDVYKAILIERPDYPFAIGAIGELLMFNNEDKAAEQKLKEAIDIIPEVGFYITLAELYKSQKRMDEFEALISEILVMLKEDTDSGHNMNLEYANLYLNLLNDIDKATIYAEKEFNKRPKNIDVNKMMAKIAIASGRNKEASIYFKTASSTGSKHPDLSNLRKQLEG